ncbi:hypothetical protein ABIA65_005807 [Mycolicibacterium sp. 624]
MARRRAVNVDADEESLDELTDEATAITVGSDS